MNRVLRRIAMQAGLVLLASCARDSAPSTPAATPPTAATPQPADAFVASVDAPGGLPSFVWATTATPAPRGASVEAAARFHLGRLAHAYRLPAAAALATELVYTHVSDSGARIVALRQRVDGVEVYPGAVKVVMKPNLDLVAISGNLRPALAPRGGFRLSPPQALASALAEHFGARVGASDVAGRGRSEGGYERVALVGAPAARAGTLRLDEPARVKPVFYAAGATLVAAYLIEFSGSTAADVTSEAFRYLVAADSGKVLERASLTADATFDYRVWAEPGGDRRPLDGPQANYTPHPTGMPDGTDAAFIAPNLVTMEAFNVNPVGVSDPWLAAGALQTLGNNVDAYTDAVAPNGYSNGDLRATTTGTRAFDHVYDVTHLPLDSVEQQMAVVTQMFYVTNWLHDYWYGSGFNELAGNAQQSNFGRGGLGSDVLLVEAQDSFLAGSRSNASMTTPGDGASPRLQMLVFNGPEVHALTVQPGNLHPKVSTPIAFGPRVFDVTGEVALGFDDTAPTGDGCEAIHSNVAGKIALIDRGGPCLAPVKVKNAQNAGAIGVLIANNVATPELVSLSGVDPTISIGTLCVSQLSGNAIKAGLHNGPVTAQLYRVADVDRDGGLDNTMVAHEWGHYLHHRLADPCNSTQCTGTSEGWADFTALHMLLREGDDLDGTYAIGGYSGKQYGDSAYYGVRRFPYSVDPSKNGLSLRHISDGEVLPDGRPELFNSEVHNTGEVWASMLWEVYVALQKKRLAPAFGMTSLSFAQVQRRMADYAVAGLELMPPQATFTEQRDALLAAIAASDASDLATAAAAFARRGLGSCAVSPPRLALDNKNALESFEVKPLLGVGALHLDDSSAACDSDGVLDAGEAGKLTVQIANGSAIASTGVDVSVSSGATGVVFPGATTVHVPAIAGFGSATVSFDVSLEAGLTGVQDLHFQISASDANACRPVVTVTGQARANTDVALASASSDDVEAEVTPWTSEGGNGWTRVADDPMQHHWHGADAAFTSDFRLVSPRLQVSATQPLVVRFKHRFGFEANLSGTLPVFFDGGVIELSSDDGQTWQDVSTLGVNPGYLGALAAGVNPLAPRRAFVSKNASYPAYETVTMDFGTQLAGGNVRLRFRAGSDAGAASDGWDIDDVRVSGIDNTPFNALVEDQPSVCPAPPQAHAGHDQTVASGQLVALDASASWDANGDPLTYTWTQTGGGPLVTLHGANSMVAAFQAPVVATSTTLTFQVSVSDGTLSSSDTTAVVVLPSSHPDPNLPDAGLPAAMAADAARPDTAPPPPPMPADGGTATVGGGGYGCSLAAGSSGRAGGTLALLGLGLAGLLLVERRRR